MRTIRISVVLAVAASLLMLPGCIRSSTTVVLVRHAERAGNAGNDPPLTGAGQQRAQALAAAMAGSGVAAIYVSQFQRTQQTAAPTAAAAGLTPVVVNTGPTTQQHAADVAARARSHAGQVVLVVGHSDTIPEIIAALGVPAAFVPPSPIPDGEFDNFFVVTLRADNGAARIVHVRYGG
jgi:broad specificity phosphatase PhoE